MESLQNFLLNNYLWIKAFHVIAVISWMAGLLYLPRLFVYHAKAKQGTESSEMLKIMEYKLQKFIMNPAMIAAIFFGVLLLIVKDVEWSKKWIYIKLIAVLGFVFVHHFLAKYRKNFKDDNNIHSSTYFKILNEVPTVLLVIIIIMIYIKPF